jgi:hypothetical protein
MAASNHVFTIARVAQMLGQDEELLHELADQLEPEEPSETLNSVAQELGAAVTHVKT